MFKRFFIRFPAELVAVDISGRGFERMSIRRRSLLSPAGQEHQDVAVKRRSRPRRPRGKRRNTIAGIDQKEIRQAIGGYLLIRQSSSKSYEKKILITLLVFPAVKRPPRVSKRRIYQRLEYPVEPTDLQARTSWVRRRNLPPRRNRISTLSRRGECRG